MSKSHNVEVNSRWLLRFQKDLVVRRRLLGGAERFFELQPADGPGNISDLYDVIYTRYK